MGNARHIVLSSVKSEDLKGNRGKWRKGRLGLTIFTRSG